MTLTRHRDKWHIVWKPLENLGPSIDWLRSQFGHQWGTLQYISREQFRYIFYQESHAILFYLRWA